MNVFLGCCLVARDTSCRIYVASSQLSEQNGRVGISSAGGFFVFNAFSGAMVAVGPRNGSVVAQSVHAVMCSPAFAALVRDEIAVRTNVAPTSQAAGEDNISLLRARVTNILGERRRALGLPLVLHSCSPRCVFLPSVRRVSV